MSPLPASSARVILLGTDPVDPRGGIGRVIPGYRKALETAGLFYEFIPSYHATARGGKFWFALKAVPRMIRAIRGLRKSNLKPVVYAHAGAWPSLVRERTLLFLAGLAGARTLLQVHSLTMHRYLQRAPSRFLVRFGLLGIDTICVLTTWWRRRLVAAGIRNSLVVLPNPLPPDLERVAKSVRETGPGSASGEVRILTMTRLVRGKHVDAVIRAMTHLPEPYRCTVAGDGPEQGRLENLGRELGLSRRLEFTGWVSGGSKSRLLHGADIFCLPSAHDSFGMGYVEAMAHGVPVVALRFGAIPDVVADGETGVLIDSPDPEEAAAAIRRLGSDPNLRDRMGRRAKSWVLERFGSAKVAELLHRIMENEVGTT